MYEKLKDFLTDDFWIMPATPKYIDKGIPYITSKNIKNGKIDYSNINYISKEDYENISKNRPIKVNDILISMIGTIGETAVVAKTDGEFYGQNMFLVRLNDKKINQRFFLNYFKSSFVKNQLFNKQNKSTQSYLKANHIEDLKVPVISIEEQKKIADKLDKIQMMIDEKKEQISLLNQLIKSQFVEMFGQPFNSNIWEYRKLGDISDNISDGNNVDTKYYLNDGEILYFRIQNVWRNEFRLDDVVFISKAANEKYQDSSLKYGDILISKIGRYYTVDSSLGRVSVYLGEDDKANYSNNIMAIRLKKNYNSQFVNALLNMDLYQNYIRRESKGGTDKRALSKKIVSEFPIISPPLELQNKYVDFVKRIDKQKFEFEKSLKKLEELQASLMQEYFG